MRAAHTLASSSRTAGFKELAELAGAVEQWIPFAAQTTEPADAKVLEDAIARLRAMTDAMARSEAPGQSADQTGRLRALTARLEWAPNVAQAAPVADPASKPEPAEGGDKRALRDDLDEQLLPVFLEEAQELVPAIGADLRDWKANPGNENTSQALRRGLRPGHAGLQPPEDVRPVLPAVLEAPEVGLDDPAHRDRDVHVRPIADRRAVEPPRRHADDRHRPAVDDDRLALDGAALAELPAPVLVIQHDDW